MKVLVLNVMNYDFEDKENKKQISGINLNYISEDVYYENLNYVGHLSSKLKITQDIVDKYKLTKQNYPFTADLTFDMSITPKGKSIPVLKTIENIKFVDVFKG